MAFKQEYAAALKAKGLSALAFPLTVERYRDEPAFAVVDLGSGGDIRCEFGDPWVTAAPLADEIARDGHEIGLQRVDLRHDPREPFGRHVGAGDVDVGEQRDGYRP